VVAKPTPVQVGRARVWDTLESTSPNDSVSKVVGVGMLILIALNGVAIVLESVDEIGVQYSAIFRWFEIVSVSAFTIEYILRVWVCTADPRYSQGFVGRLKYMLSPMALIDLMAVVPFYVALIDADLRALRLLRLFRVFRLLKFGRYIDALLTFGRVIRAKSEELVIIFSVIVILLLIASSLVYFAERDAQPVAFRDIPSTMWWAVITLTTVGYGDTYPVTLLGRLLGGILAVLGIGLFALPAGILASGFMDELRNRSRSRTCPHCGRALH